MHRGIAFIPATAANEQSIPCEYNLLRGAFFTAEVADVALGVEGRLYALDVDAAHRNLLFVCYQLRCCCYMVVLASNDLDAWDALGHLLVAPSMVPAKVTEIEPWIGSVGTDREGHAVFSRFKALGKSM